MSHSDAISPHREGPTIPWQLGVYIALMLLLVLTIIAAHFPLGPAALLVALAIAAMKSILVMLYFMHVRFSSRVTWLFVGAGFLWLSILFTLTFSEYAGRTHLSRAQPLNASQQPAARRENPSHEPPRDVSQK